MRIVIFGGTTEGRTLSYALADAGADVIISVISEYGARMQGEYPGVSVEVGPKSWEEMRDLIKGVDLVVDATHPYAVEATDNIRRAAEEGEVERIRLRRRDDKAWENSHEEELERTVIWASDRTDAIEKARAKAEERKGNILLTTGVRDLSFYCENCDRERLYARVLPSKESISLCADAGLDPERIIAIQGPFSAQLNVALIHEYHIAVMITKESGKAGGFREKLQACRSCDIPAVVISRPEDRGSTYDEVLDQCLKMCEKR